MTEGSWEGFRGSQWPEPGAGCLQGSGAHDCLARFLPRWGPSLGDMEKLSHRPSSEACGFDDSGTDEDTIIDIITHRSNAQRQQIRQTYKSHFGRVRVSS